MKWTFRIRGKQVVLNIVDGAVAVRPTTELRQRANRSLPKMVAAFGAKLHDDSEKGTFGLDLPARNRKLFEKAGWLFVEPEARVARAAVARTNLADAETVQPVLSDATGGMLVATDLVTLQFADDLSDAEAKRLLREDGFRLARRLTFGENLYEVHLPKNKPLTEAIAELQESSRYRFVEPVLLQPITGRLRPTDPDYHRQWQHHNDGSNGGTAGADIRSEAAWDITKGKGDSRAMRIAVIDNGIHVNHPDLKPGIIGGGYFEDDITSSTFVRYKPGDSGFPTGDHGTFCLGMAGARMNNSRGGCGSAPEADLIPIACLNDQVGTQTTLARALAYAADPSREDGSARPEDGADVISVSLGPNGADWTLTSVLEQAILFATEQARGGRGVPVFWAVSNGPFDVSRDEVSSHPNVIAVGRSNRHDEEDGSAFGNELDFLAPGRDVYNSKGSNRYGTGTGTSYATPLAAGVAALVLSRYPDWTADQVRQRLRDTCDKIGGVTYDAQGRHPEYGFGRINAELAVQ